MTHLRIARWIVGAVALGLLLTGGGPVAAQIPDEFTNLQLLPEEIGRRDLVGIMRNFASSLGVRCTHCLPGPIPGALEGVDFPSDDLETKRVAREMMKMTDQINSKLLPATGRDELLEVRCVTCHRGLSRPVRIGDVLTAALEDGGVEAAKAKYRELREEYYGQGAYDFGQGPLNNIAETLAREKQDMDGAIALLELNVELNPDAASPNLTLGRFYMMKGDNEKAIARIERALEIDPNNDHAKQMLERVKAAE